MVRTPKVKQDQVLKLASEGNSNNDIARIMNTDKAYISRLLKRARDNKNAVSIYKQLKSEIIQGNVAQVQDKITEILDKLDIEAIPPQYRALALEQLTRAYKVMYEAGRLEEGKSTDNIGVVVQYAKETRSNPLDIEDKVNLDTLNPNN